MATALHLSGVKSPSSAISRRGLHCQPLWTKYRFDLASATSVSSLCRTLESSCRRRALRISCVGGSVDVLQRNETKSQDSDEVANELTCVMKFGGSSVASAERMREVAELIRSFPEERPVIVLSAMGKTTNNLLLV